MRLFLSQIAQAIGAAHATGAGENDICCTRVETDSRRVQPGDLFFCLVGENHDGHDYAREAHKNGAAAVVAYKDIPALPGAAVLRVHDTGVALRDLARFWRKRTRARVVGITGSAGKTTCKEIAAAVLGAYGRVGASYKNWNNQIGLPLSILRFSGDEDFWLVELGISQKHDMDELGEVVAPDIALILNVGVCHSAGLGSLEEVAAAKASLLSWLRPKGTALVCADYPRLVACAGQYGKETVYFSQKKCPEAAFSAQVLQVENGQTRYRLSGKKDLLVTMPGQPLPETLAAVYGLVHALGLDPGRFFVEKTASFQPVEQRFVVHTIADWQIIDDTYNANPLSMRQAIDAAARLAGEKELVLVLGRMGELGELSAKEHERLGAQIARSAVKRLFFYGHEELVWVRLGLGQWSGQVVELASQEDFLSCLEDFSTRAGVVLFKGSRSCGMEKFLRVFQSFWEDDSKK